MKAAPAARPLTQADRLAPYRNEILKLRRRGLTWRQIADGMSDPRIADPATEKLLNQVLRPTAGPTRRPTGPPKRRRSRPRRTTCSIR